MSVKITEKALREFIKSRLLEQSRSEDARAEETNPPAVSEYPLDQLETPLEAEPQVVDTELGPPIADPGYVPEGTVELKAAVGKMLDDVPETSVGVAYKIVKKTLNNLHDVLRQRAELSPGVPTTLPGAELQFDSPITQDEPVVQMSMNESSPVEKLLFLLSEQYGGSYEMDDPAMKGEEDEEEEEIKVRSATYSDDREVSPPAPKEPEAVDDVSQFDRFFKKKMSDMLSFAQARHPDKLKGVTDWNSVDNFLSAEEHLSVMDDYDAELARKYPVLANASGKDFEPPVKATLVAAVEDFMKSASFEPPAEDAEVDLIDDETDDRLTSMIGRDMDLVDIKSKSAQDQAAKEALRRELFRMSVGSSQYYQGLIDILRKPESVSDKKLQKGLDVALKDFAEEESMPETDSDYFLFIAYMNQDLRPDEKVNYRNTVLNRAAEHMMSQLEFAGAKGRAERPHINKDSTLANVMAAVEGIKARGDRADADRLEKLSDILDKMLPKGETVPVINILDKDTEEVAEPEEKTQIARSPGGKTFRRQRAEPELSEGMTPADAILKSRAVNPDLDRAMNFLKEVL